MVSSIGVSWSWSASPAFIFWVCAFCILQSHFQTRVIVASPGYHVPLHRIASFDSAHFPCRASRAVCHVSIYFDSWLLSVSLYGFSFFHDSFMYHIQGVRKLDYNLRLRISCWRWGLETGDYGLETAKRWDFGAPNVSQQICLLVINFLPNFLNKMY